MDSCHVFTHIRQGCFIVIEAIINSSEASLVDAGKKIGTDRTQQLSLWRIIDRI